MFCPYVGMWQNISSRKRKESPKEKSNPVVWMSPLETESNKVDWES